VCAAGRAPPHFFTIDVERAGFITYDGDGGKHVSIWRRDRPWS
jgi:hypothetical protein